MYTRSSSNLRLLTSNAIHTYIHNWSLQPFSQDYDLASHTTYVVLFPNLLRGSRRRNIFIFSFLMSDLGFKLWPYVHIYIHNWLLQLFSQDYDPASHATCVRYFYTWMAGPSVSTPNDKFLRSFFVITFFNTQSFCLKSAERKSPKEYFHIFGLTWEANTLLTVWLLTPLMLCALIWT